MAMNPRLLRPRQGGDPDALRYIAAIQSGKPLPPLRTVDVNEPDPGKN